MREDGQGDPSNNSGRLGPGDGGKNLDPPTQRGSIERRARTGAAVPTVVLAENVDKRENPELASGRRTVLVKGTGGVTATVVVRVQRGTVWLSIQPPFTWEAIMDPDKVDELMQALAQAQGDAKNAAERYRL